MLSKPLKHAWSHRKSGRATNAVLLPCYNEATTIAKVDCRFPNRITERKIYVYDNNSTDATKREAQRAGAIVRVWTYQGKGNVVRRMFADIDADVYFWLLEI